MSEYILARHGAAPLKIAGELLAEIDQEGDRRNRWYVLRVYRAGEQFAAAVEYHTRWQGESDVAWAWLGTAAEIRRALQEHDPIPARIGFPAGESYAERQRKLLAELAELYLEGLGELLFTAADEFAVTTCEPPVVAADLQTAAELSRYRDLLRRELARVEFTRGEACCVCDALNGCLLLDGLEGQHSSMVWWPAEVEDAMRLDGIDAKWDVDGPALLKKLAALTPGQRFAVADAAERFWQASSAQQADESIDGQLRAVGLLRGEVRA